jgi:DNA-binding NtrC family response regulator
MPLTLQAKILRVLQEQAFERVGGNETIATDVRIIAATHRDLKAWSEAGKFRLDLYYRLSVFTIHLPPLRERGDDLPMLACHYLRRFSREKGREVVEIAPAAMDRLRDYSWPGNIRELQNVLRQTLLRARGRILLPEFLPELPRDADRVGSGGGSVGAGRGPDLESFIRQGLAAGTGGLHERRRIAGWSGSSCRWSWSTRKATSDRPPGSWASPARRSGTSSASWASPSSAPRTWVKAMRTERPDLFDRISADPRSTPGQFRAGLASRRPSRG